jgi:hypothetical protein
LDPLTDDFYIKNFTFPLQSLSIRPTPSLRSGKKTAGLLPLIGSKKIQFERRYVPFYFAQGFAKEISYEGWYEQNEPRLVNTPQGWKVHYRTVKYKTNGKLHNIWLYGSIYASSGLQKEFVEKISSLRNSEDFSSLSRSPMPSEMKDICSLSEEQGSKKGFKRMQEMAEAKCSADISNRSSNFTNNGINHMTTEYSYKRLTLVYLPLYIVKYDDIYQFILDGGNGNIAGAAPISSVKVDLGKFSSKNRIERDIGSSSAWYCLCICWSSNWIGNTWWDIAWYWCQMVFANSAEIVS